MSKDNKYVTSWLPESPISQFTPSELSKLAEWGKDDSYELLLKWFYKQLEFNMMSALGQEDETQQKFVKAAEAVRTVMQMVITLPATADQKLKKNPGNDTSITEKKVEE